MMQKMAEEVKLLENELLEKLRNVKKRIEEFEELIKKYGIDDPDVNSELYFFAREDLLKLIECIYRISTDNPKFESLFTVLREIVLPPGSEYDLLDDFRILIVLTNYKVMLNIYMENIGGNTEFYMLEKDHDEKKFNEIYYTVKEVFRYGRDITNQ